MKILLNVILIFAAFMNFSAHASWVSSGGGVLIRDAHNPWFLRNVTDVSYCIEINKLAVSPTSSFNIDSIVRNSINFWKNDIKGASDPYKLGIATQNFHKVDKCTDDVDLQFLIGTMDDHKKTRLKEMGVDISKHIAFSIRTDYDPKTLRGKGFIYVMPDIRRDMPEDLISLPWAYPGLMERVLSHELGHVFGIPHTLLDPFHFMNIMGERFAEEALSKRIFPLNVLFFSVFDLTPPFFQTNQTQVNYNECTAEDLEFSSLREYFDLPSDDKEVCYVFETSETDFKIAQGKRIKVDDWKELSKIKYETIGTAPLSIFTMTPKYVSDIVVTKQQTVFPDYNEVYSIAGPLFLTKSMKGVFTNTKTGLQYEIGVYKDFTTIILSGVKDGKIVPNLNVTDVSMYSGSRFPNFVLSHKRK